MMGFMNVYLEIDDDLNHEVFCNIVIPFFESIPSSNYN